MVRILIPAAFRVDEAENFLNVRGKVVCLVPHNLPCVVWEWLPYCPCGVMNFVPLFGNVYVVSCTCKTKSSRPVCGFA